MTERSVTAKSVDEDLGELAQEVKDLGRGIDALRNEFTGFRSSVETELRLIRKLGGWFVGGLFGVFISVVVGRHRGMERLGRRRRGQVSGLAAR